MKAAGQIQWRAKCLSPVDLAGREVFVDDRLEPGKRYLSPPFRARNEVQAAVMAALPRPVIAMLLDGEFAQANEIAARVAPGVVPGATFEFVAPPEGDAGPRADFYSRIDVPPFSDRVAEEWPERGRP